MNIKKRISAALVVGAALSIAIGAGPASAIDGTLRLGSTGGRVACWQAALNVSNGIQGIGSKIVVDRSFGPATLRNTKSFQSANGLAADGVVGNASKKKMFSRLNIILQSGNSAQKNLVDNARFFCGTQGTEI